MAGPDDTLLMAATLRDEFSEAARKIAESLKHFDRDVSTVKTRRELDLLKESVRTVGEEIKTAITLTGIGGVIGGGLILSLAGITKALVSFAQGGLQAHEVSRSLGISAESLKRFELAAEASGATSEQAAAGIRSFADAMLDLRRRSFSSTWQAFTEKFGLGGRDFARDLADQLQAGGLESAMDMFLGRVESWKTAGMTWSVSLVKDILHIGPIDLASLRKVLPEFAEIALPSEEDSKAFLLSYVKLTAELEHLKVHVGNQLLPVFADLVHTFREWLSGDDGQRFQRWIIDVASSLKDVNWRELGEAVIATLRAVANAATDFVNQSGGVVRSVDDLNNVAKSWKKWPDNPKEAPVRAQQLMPAGAPYYMQTAPGPASGTKPADRPESEIDRRWPGSEIDRRWPTGDTSRDHSAVHEDRRTRIDLTRSMKSTAAELDRLNLEMLGEDGAGGSGGGLGGLVQKASYTPSGGNYGLGGGGAGGGGGGSGGGRSNISMTGGEKLDSGYFAPVTSSRAGGGLGDTSASMGRGAHGGDDYMTPRGSGLYAVKDGTILRYGRDNQGGMTMTVRHSDGSTETYMHLSERIAPVGSSVRGGELIGRSGVANSVPHLHFEMRDPSGRRISPRDQLGIIKKQRDEADDARKKINDTMKDNSRTKVDVDVNVRAPRGTTVDGDVVDGDLIDKMKVNRSYEPEGMMRL